ncbi:hypothetical protein PENTCL1PPCAC_3874, partial [Pristionchus entomophagus]
VMFMRREIIGDTKVSLQVHVTEHEVDALQCARAIADAKDLKNNDESFMIYNLDALVERLALWKRELPQIEPFYAVKCNNDETMVRTLAALGIGFDCASRREIDLALRSGATANRIIYANPHKTRSFIEHAEENGVNLMTFDNAEELQKIAEHHACPELILRFACTDHTAAVPLNIKFGADPVQVAPELFKLASKMGLCIRGVSFHVGSGSKDPSIFRVAIQYARTLFDIGLALGHKMDILDIGGGFPGVDYLTAPFETFAAHVRSAVAEFFPEPEVRIIAEPGRFFAARACTLVVNVIARHAVPADKITKNAHDEISTGHMYYVNDGLFGSFHGIVFDQARPTGAPLHDEDGMLCPSTIWGPSCNSSDKIE